jgi:hypothetical protein
VSTYHVGQLTRTVLFNLLCHNGKDTKNLDHDPHDSIRHSSARGDLNVCLQPLEDVFYAREEVNE